MLQLSTKRMDNDDLAKLQPSVQKYSPKPSTSLPGVPEEVTCHNCGAGFLNDMQFCRKCGHPRASQAALVTAQRPRKDFARKGVSFGAAAPTIPNAPPRLIARLQELELESLLALCERLEGRLVMPKKSKMVKASDEELEALCESLADGKPLTPRQHHHQQQLQYLNHLREARQNAPAVPPPTATTKARASPVPTEVPSAPLLSPETSPQAAPAAAPSSNVLDALLIELNELLEKVPLVSAQDSSASAASPEPGQRSQPANSPKTPGSGPVRSPQRSPERSPQRSPQRSLPSNSQGAGPLPVDERQARVALFGEDADSPKPTASQAPASFTEAVKLLQAGLQNLEELFASEVAQVSEDLQVENSGLLKELEEMRGKVKEPAIVASAECQTELEEVVPADAEVCWQFPPEGDIVASEEAILSSGTFVQGAAVKEQRLDSAHGPPCPDCGPPASPRLGFSVCTMWQEDLQPGQADWGEDAVEFASTSKKCQVCWKMHEFSRGRLAWDLLGLLLILYDAFATPWQLAFGEIQGSAEVMAWTLPLYWTATILLTFFCTTFSLGGVLQTSKKAMARRYVQGFFVLDFVTTCLDILLLSVRYEMSNANYTAIQSMVKDKDIFLAIQSVRLLRTLRLNRNLLGVRARVRSEVWRSLGSLAGSALILLIGAHIIACALYYLGSSTGGNADTWLEEYAQTQQQEDKVLMYFSALLWAIAQLTPGLGPSPVNPRSFQDLVFSNVVHVLALAGCIFLLYQVAGTALRLRDLQGDWPRRRTTCRQYLAEGPRPAASLHHHIWSWLENEPEPRSLRPNFKGWKGPRSLAPSLPSQVAQSSPLHALPPTVQQELMSQLSIPLLTLHPFFHELDVAHPQAIKEVVKCLQQLFYSPMQEIFVAATTATCMQVIAKGKTMYNKDVVPGSKRLKDVPVTIGQHVAEAGLWLQDWTHRGTLTVNGLQDSCCEVLSLDSLSFATLLRKGPCELWQAASSYARAFARRASDLNLSDLDADTEALMKITDEAFSDALRYLAKEAGRDAGEGIGPVGPVSP